MKVKSSRNKTHGFWDNMQFHFREMRQREPLALAFFLIALPLGVLLPLLNARLPKVVLQGLEERWPLPVFLKNLIILILLLALANAVSSGIGSYLQTMNGPFEDSYNLRLIKKRLAVDYSVTESGRFNEEAYAVYDSLYRSKSEMKNSFLIWQKFLTALISTALYGSILFMQSAFICLVVLLPAVIAFFLQRKAHSRYLQMHGLVQASSRKMDYVMQKATDFQAGKDIRIFDLSGWFLGIFRKEQKVSEKNVRQWERGYLTVNSVNAVLNFARDGFAYLFLILEIAQGKMAVSDFVWYMAVVAGCQQSCAAFLEQRELLGKLNHDYDRLRDFLGRWEDSEFSGKQDRTPQGAVEIRFSHVSFTYPESEKATLADLDFVIRPGERIALAGRSGAGKTTLAKLLCGLCHPTQGEILVNGRNVKEYDRESYFKMVSAVFQDAALLPLSIAQNVSADPECVKSQDKIRECLKLAGLWEKVDSLPGKERTSLGKGITENAAVLSGGERQKLWMARALYKEAPILILDEPAAALDPLAEQEIYKKYMEMSKERTSLFISHRLSGARFCDRVFFLEDGKITEQGTHKELLEKNGSYARLYRIQSRYYKGQGKETAV